MKTQTAETRLVQFCTKLQEIARRTNSYRLFLVPSCTKSHARDSLVPFCTMSQPQGARWYNLERKTLAPVQSRTILHQKILHPCNLVTPCSHPISVQDCTILYDFVRRPVSRTISYQLSPVQNGTRKIRTDSCTKTYKRRTDASSYKIATIQFLQMLIALLARLPSPFD